MVLFPIVNERCQKQYQIGLMTSIEQIMQPEAQTTSRITYQSYFVNLTFNTDIFAKVCFTKIDVVLNATFPYQSGNYIDRQKKYINDFSKAKGTPTFLVNHRDYYILQNVIFTDFSALLYILIGVFGGILILVITLVGMKIREQQ